MYDYFSHMMNSFMVHMANHPSHWELRGSDKLLPSGEGGSMIREVPEFWMMVNMMINDNDLSSQYGCDSFPLLSVFLSLCVCVYVCMCVSRFFSLYLGDCEWGYAET